MCEEDKYRILELLDMMLDAIRIIQSRTVHVQKSDDFLLTSDDMFILDGICMKLIFLGESVKSIDKLSKGELFPSYPLIPWREIMKLRDIIAHHYFKIDVEIVFSTIMNDLDPLSEVLAQMRTDLQL